MYVEWSMLGIKTYLIDVDCSTLNKKNRYELYIGSKTKYSMSKTYLFVTVHCSCFFTATKSKWV